MEVSNHYPAAWLMTIAFGLATVATTDFFQVVFFMSFCAWFVISAVWTLIISINAITKPHEPEGDALA